MKKHIKKMITLALLCAMTVALLALQGSSVGLRPEDWVVDNRSDYYLWEQVTGKNDIPYDGQWHRMMLFFQWDTGDSKTHYINADWTLQTEYQTNGKRYLYYFDTPNIAGDPYVNLDDDYFYTKDHYKTFFVKRVGHDEYYDNTQVIFQLGDANGDKTGKYIGLVPRTKVYSSTLLTMIDIVGSESEALVFNMVTQDSEGNGGEVYKDSLMFFHPESPYWTLTDRGTWFYFNDSIRTGAFGLMTDPWPHTYEFYADYKMYLGKPFTTSVVAGDVTIGPGEIFPITGSTIIPEGVTIRVKKGGTLSISGSVFNSGSIYNEGTVVINRDATLGPDEKTKTSSFICDGGSLIVDDSAKVYFPDGMTMKNNAICENRGTMIFYKGLRLGDGTFYNDMQGAVYMGYKSTSEAKNFPKSRPVYESGNQTYNSINIPYTKASANQLEVNYDATIDKLYRMSDFWTMIGDNAEFYNEGMVYQATIACSSGDLDWCKNKTSGTHSGEIVTMPLGYVDTQMTQMMGYPYVSNDYYTQGIIKNPVSFTG